jgi:hypothetical protein
MTESVRRPSLAGHPFLKGSFRDVSISFRNFAIARTERAELAEVESVSRRSDRYSQDPKARC